MRLSDENRLDTLTLRTFVRDVPRICAGSSVIAGIPMSQPDIGERPGDPATPSLARRPRASLCRAAAANEAEDHEDDAGRDERDRGQL